MNTISDIVHAYEINLDFILNHLTQAEINAQKVDDETILALIEDAKVMIKVKPNLIYLHSVIALNKAFNQPIDFTKIALLCNELNASYVIRCSIDQDIENDFLFHTNHAILFNHKVSMPDFIYQLLSFVASTTNIWHTLSKTFHQDN